MFERIFQPFFILSLLIIIFTTTISLQIEKKKKKAANWVVKKTKMRRSLGGGNGGFNGGGVFRSVARTVTRGTVGGGAGAAGGGSGGGGGGGGGGLQEPFPSTTSPPSPSSKKRIKNKPNSKNLLTLSSSSSSSSVNSVPVSATATSSSSIWPYYTDDFEWVSVDDEDVTDVTDVEFGIGSRVPSLNEVQFAVSALQQAKITRDTYGTSSDEEAGNQVSPPTSFRSNLDWIEPSMQSYNSRSLQPYGRNTVYDAFYLLQTDRAVQRMVISLSSDKAVWDAVMNNDVVRELRESFDTAEDYSLPISDDDSDENVAASNIVKWLLESTKAKATELFGTIMQLVNQLFKPYETELTTEGGAGIDLFEDKLRSSLLLTVMVLLVVVVGRASTA